MKTQREKSSGLARNGERVALLAKQTKNYNLNSDEMLVDVVGGIGVALNVVHAKYRILPPKVVIATREHYWGRSNNELAQYVSSLNAARRMAHTAAKKLHEGKTIPVIAEVGIRKKTETGQESELPESEYIFTRATIEGGRVVLVHKGRKVEARWGHVWHWPHKRGAQALCAKLNETARLATRALNQLKTKRGHRADRWFELAEQADALELAKNSKD